jgi:hypothetical protein
MCAVVLYKGKYFLHYRTNTSGFAQLIDEHGAKFSGTPTVDKLQVVKTLQSRQYNGHSYVSTKCGVFSLSTGSKMVHPDILALFA